MRVGDGLGISQLTELKITHLMEGDDLSTLSLQGVSMTQDSEALLYLDPEETETNDEIRAIVKDMNPRIKFIRRKGADTTTPVLFTTFGEPLEGTALIRSYVQFRQRLGNGRAG